GISASIAAASIIAKVTRDRLMVEYDRLYPGYGFGEHKGYCTPGHMRIVEAIGPSPIHRRSFSPVAIASQLKLFGREADSGCLRAESKREEEVS
ncbi:MAG TPA: hypothetical protein VMT64_14405, partial [Candidatus Binataceae bacterium]|nr:hypothetical protein [Candidatus Binataceae bacterium]